MIHKLESTELAMLVPFFAMCLYFRKYTWHCKCKKTKSPLGAAWSQMHFMWNQLLQRSHRTQVVGPDFRPDAVVHLAASQLLLPFRGGCKYRLITAFAKPRMCRVSGLPRLTGMKPLARQSAFRKNTWALSGSMASTDTAKTKLIHMDQGLECLPVYTWSESLKEQYPVEWSELHEINYECAVTCWSLVKTRLDKAPHIANKKLNKWPVHWKLYTRSIMDEHVLVYADEKVGWAKRLR